MPTVSFFAETDLALDLDAIVSHLNGACSHVRFRKGRAALTISTPVVDSASSYDDLGSPLSQETTRDLLALLFTRKPYNNNYFYETSSNRAIVSLDGWKYLTSLPITNGAIYFAAALLALRLDNSFRHREPTGCIYDFHWTKNEIDQGMRFGGICPTCLTRLSRKRKTKTWEELFVDLRTILDDLAAASKWNQDILDYWAERENRSQPASAATAVNLLTQNDFIPHNDNGEIRLAREHIDKLCGLYVELAQADQSRKGKIFEDFAVEFFASIKGWRVIDTDARLAECEVDLVLDISKGPEVLRERMGSNIYVECKNRSHKSEVKDISHFIVNLQSRGLAAGIFFSYNGITGFQPENWRKADQAAYRRIVDVSRREKLLVLPMVSQDIEAVRSGTNLVEHLQEILNRFVLI